ncbi:sensor histidine kinase [Corynebacterium kutscheri]|uniref:sensor histidine kinase n=1 Tax=Corynebacterium kutscheri TaxID=35755 RepID=UPI000F82B35C|nr:sensor histidine kinase [Corynebacterium kutscheri]
MSSSLERDREFSQIDLQMRAGDVDTYDSQPGAASFRIAMNLLTAVLLIVTLGTIVGFPRATAVMAVCVAAAFGALYAASVVRSSDSLWMRVCLLIALTVVWSLMLPIMPVSVYLVFPLFFLYLRVLPDYRGMIAVCGATAIAIFANWNHLTIGAVMGPVVSALVSIGIHLAFLALWKGARQREALITELLETRNQLAETERAAGIAAERQRIAHEIHDTVAQGLSSIQMLLRVAETDIAALDAEESAKNVPISRIELARRTAADNLSEARAMIAALQPAALAKTNLEGALERVATHMVGPDFSIEVDGEEHQLPMRTEAALLRIAQGAMGNVAKHANATLCHVTLSYSDNEVRLDVVDNGQGFDPNTIKDRPAGLGHIGISAMRQRAEEQGGTLEVESTPGGGTAVSVALPISSADVAETPAVDTPPLLDSSSKQGDTKL